MTGVNLLSTMDYVSLVVLSILSCFVGFYHMFTTKRYNVREFLMKNPNLNVLTLILSIMASSLSGAAFLGLPREVYMNGIIFGMRYITSLFVIPFGVYVFLPVIFNLGYSSIFQYFEQRFDKFVRRSTSFLFILNMVMRTSIEIFVPSLILNQVTGIHLWVFVGATGFICIIYTAFGGLKAIIWADAVQATVMFSTVLLTIITGTMDSGGVAEVWQRNENGKRTDLFIFTSSQYTRVTSWTVCIAAPIGALHHFAGNQMHVQRYLSNNTLRNAKITFAGGVFVYCILGFLLSFLGLVTYAQFHECDPLLSKEISYRDQIFAFMALKVLSGVDGLTGVFMSTILIAAVSTMSSALNSAVAVTMEDFVIPLKPNIKEKMLLALSKSLTIAFGLLCILLVYLIQALDNIYMTMVVVSSSTTAPVFFLFLCGMALPWIKTMPAIIGMLSGMAFVLTASIGNLKYAKLLPYAPLSTAGCNMNSTFFNASALVNATGSHNTEIDSASISDVPQLYLLSYIWYTPYCIGMAFLVAIFITIIFGAQSPDDVDPKLIFPFVIKMCHRLPKRIQKILKFKEVTPEQKESANLEMHPMSSDNVDNLEISN